MQYVSFATFASNFNSMHLIVLIFHSFFRWLVLASLIFAIVRSFRGWMLKKQYSVLDNRIRHWTATIAHIQLILGLWLYFISPLISYFWHNYHVAAHQREIRFFSMEHSSMMLLSIIIITIGSAKAKRMKTDKGKYKIAAITFSIALLIILLSVPWPFSPMAGRPYFRIP
ncbi:hypothetical protein SNE26_24410 [Mucilaginibacter sp. cycad4]|uniref:hypothetical protein n=1 Tax=Mucilaginibacter sp. cycad4 TaxID=3342096 RepID=UPI002AAB27ED|nr:hypothetical protein [Mucilaginibacter gossypii]WPU99160.1 hypothetical protein SNE26_24410 [Mucilaginibacter gossypii]